MRSDDIFDGVTEIRDDLIDGAKEAPKKRKFVVKKRWLGAVAAAVAAAILAGIFLRPRGVLAACAIAQAKYPQMSSYLSRRLEPYSKGNPAYDAWWADVQGQQRDLGDTTALRAFLAQSTQAFLTGAEGENRVYSPLNVYMALSMLAQLTGGESRAQILELLGSGSIDALRQQAGDVWNSNYRDDGAVASILASSLWLSEDVRFERDTMNTLARDFYASSFRGEMGSDDFNKALQAWLNEQTGGLLQEQAGSIELDADTILALATTVCFKARWDHEFSESKTEPQTFHTPGGDMETDFMFQREDQPYYWGDKFAAVGQYFKVSGGTMWFLLPDEGVSPEELLSDAEAMDFLFAADRSEWENQKLLFVNKSIPKFDVSSQFDLRDGLKALGVTNVFDPLRSDFTPMTTDVDVPMVLAQASHAARVVIDEEGCTAAAFTELMVLASSRPYLDTGEVDFVLDRPFLFCITGISSLPLFVGVVNHPVGG